MIMKKEKLIEIIENFSKVQVLVIGDIMVDHFIYGNVSRISPEAPVPIVDVYKEEILLGGSANVINNIHSIGGQVIGVGVIGNDIESKLVIDEFKKRNLRISGLVTDTTRRTTLKTRIVAHSQQVVRFDKETRKDLDTKILKDIMKYVVSIIDEIDCIVISDYNKGVVSRVLLDSLRVLNKDNVPICVDPKKSDFSIFSHADIVTPNLQEAQAAIPYDINEYNLSKVGHDILYKYDLESVLITQGEKGMTLFEKNGEVIESHYLPTEAKQVYDVTGAGDTVIGILSLALGTGASYKESSTLANLAAGIVVGKVGTSTVSKDELVNLIKEKYKE